MCSQNSFYSLFHINLACYGTGSKFGTLLENYILIKSGLGAKLILLIWMSKILIFLMLLTSLLFHCRLGTNLKVCMCGYTVMSFKININNHIQITPLKSIRMSYILSLLSTFLNPKFVKPSVSDSQVLMKQLESRTWHFS